MTTAVEIIEARKLTEFGVHLRSLVIAKFPTISDFLKASQLIIADAAGRPEDRTKRNSPSQLYSAFGGHHRVPRHIIAIWATVLEENPEEFELLYDRPDTKITRTKAAPELFTFAGPGRATSALTGEEFEDGGEDPCIKMTVDRGGRATLRVNLISVPVELALQIIGLINAG